MSSKDAGWDDLSPTTIISCNNQNKKDVIFPKGEMIINQSISWTNRDLINHSDKCPRSILKELGSLNLLRISGDRAQLSR